MGKYDSKLDEFGELLEQLIQDESHRSTMDVLAFLHWIRDEKINLNLYPSLVENLVKSSDVIAKSLENSTLFEEEFQFFYMLARTLFARHDYDNMLELGIKAINVFEKMDEDVQEKHQLKASNTHYYCGFACFIYSNYNQASAHYYSALNIFDQLGREQNRARLHNGLGFVYRNMKDYPSAMEHFQKAFESAHNTGERDNEVISLNEIGNIYMLQKNYAKSAEFHQKALNIAVENKSEALNAFVYHDIGVMYYEMDQLEKSIEYFMKHFNLTKDTQTVREKAITSLNLGAIQTKMENYKEAKSYIIEALDFAIEANALYEQGLAHEQLALICDEMKDHEEAFSHMYDAYQLREKVFNDESVRQISNLQLKYESEAKKREAEIYRLKNVELVEANEKLRESYERLESAQNEIIQLEKQKSVWAMAVTANHEINQPLMVIRGNMDLLRMKLEAFGIKDLPQHYLDNIEKSISRIGDILQKFKEKCPVRYTDYSSKTEMVVFDEEGKND